MFHLLRRLLRMLGRLLLTGLALAALFLGWHAFLRFGPGAGLLYPFHAKALVRSRLAFPRPGPPILLPVPPQMSSADVQLRLMKWWDGRHWLPEALAHGESTPAGLRLHPGEVALGEVLGVAPQPTPGGTASCTVRIKVRWDAPEDLQELLRVRDIVALRLPKGPAPGQTAELACGFERKGWRWEAVSLDSPWSGRQVPAPAARTPLDWLF